jgi:PmbA protein
MDIAEQLLDLAKTAGAEAAEVYHSTAKSNPVFFEANRLKQLETTQSEGIALRLWKSGQPGLTVAYGPVSPQILVEKTLSLCNLNPPEEPELTAGSLQIYPDLGESIAVEKSIEMGKQSIELIRDLFPDVICTGQWDCEVETTRLVNSLGLDCRYQDTTLSSYLAAESIAEGDFLSVGDGQTQRSYLDSQKLADSIIHRLYWAKDNAPAPKGKVPVVFTAKAADMLWETVQAALNGKQVVEGSSPWSKRQGDRIGSSLLTLMQIPHRGPYSCPFDDEGLATKDLTLIESGNLVSFYTDRAVGKRLGTGSTGNGFRSGLGSYPTPGLVNLAVAPGNLSFDQLIHSLDRALIVDQILGGGAGISGDFSVNIDLGYAIAKGEIIGRVKDTMVSGNVYGALDRVIALGNDIDWNGPCFTPSIVVDGLSIVSR